MNFWQTYSFIQLVKILEFMGLTYKDLYSKDVHSNVLRNNLYKEKTNVLAYYVLKTILINNYGGFLSWCDKNNFSLFVFKKTFSNQNKFCDFIKNNYKKKDFLNNIDHTYAFFNNLKLSKEINRNLRTFLLSNLRMTICELG